MNIMKTLQKQIFPNGKEGLIFSQADFPASLSALPDKEREQMMNVISGRKCFVPYAKSGPLGSLVKTLLESSRWFSPARRLKWSVHPLFSERVTRSRSNVSNSSSKPSAKTLSKRDIPSNRCLFRLVPSERRTEGTGYGLLPTVQTQGLKVCNEKGKTEFMPLTMLPTPTSIDAGTGRMNKSKSKNAKERPTIALSARLGLLPTPNASEGTKWTTKYNPNSQMGTGLTAMAVNGLLPTPMASDATMGAIIGKKDVFVTTKNGTPRKVNQNGQNGSLGLARYVQMLPTPQARDFKGQCAKTQSCLPNHFGTSRLNPLFVAEMMGFPADWTVLPFLNGEKKA